jgi:RNA polymerase sigma-70 factor (ECF subfamily)
MGLRGSDPPETLYGREVDMLSLDGAPDARTADEVEATALQATDRQESPLAELESRELGSQIELAVGKLRPEYRTCILLRHVEGRSYDEIAEVMDLPLGTVKTYIHRARLELREYLAHLRS